MLTTLAFLALLRSPIRVVGDWTSKDLHYTFNAKGEYLALVGEMDHQGTYRVEGRRVLITPLGVGQRPAIRFLRELAQDPSRIATEDTPLVKTLARPYALTLSTDGKSLVGPRIRVHRDPKAKPLF